MLARSARSLLARSSRFRSPPSAFRSLCSVSAAALPALATLRPTALQAFDLRFAVPLAPLVRSPFHSEKKSGIFEKKERSRRTHIFPENGIFGFCSASAPQKHNSQKSTLHNTQLCDIFNPSAFGYGKCLITCVMYKPLRLWLRGSTFLLGRSDQSTAFEGVRLFSAWSLRPPELCSCDLRSNAPPDRLSRRSFSAFPPPPDRLCRRSTCGGVGCGAINRPSASAFGWVALVGFASLRSLGGVLSPLRSDVSEKKIAKGFAFHNFFSDKNTTIPTNCTIFAL